MIQSTIFVCNITDKYTRKHFYQRIYTKQKTKAIIFHFVNCTQAYSFFLTDSPTVHRPIAVSLQTAQLYTGIQLYLKHTRVPFYHLNLMPPIHLAYHTFIPHLSHIHSTFVPHSSPIYPTFITYSFHICPTCSTHLSHIQHTCITHSAHIHLITHLSHIHHPFIPH